VPQLLSCRAVLLAGVAAALVLTPSGRDSRADAGAWRERLGKGDADERFAAIESARTSRDPAATLPLLEAAVAAEHAHLAVACGEALAAIGSVQAKSPEVAKFVLGGVKAKEDAKQVNLARALAAWGAPEMDPHLAQLAAGRRAPGVQAEALFLWGSPR
jgi:hypothetical protein